MEVILFIGLLSVGGLTSFVVKPAFKFTCNLALAYIFMSTLISISSWLFYCAAINNLLINKALTVLTGSLGTACNLILGFLLAGISRSVTSAEANYDQLKKIIALTLWGVSISTGFSFIIESFWKDQNSGKMCCFFITSGYAPWFLYVIMAAGALGGLGILLHFKLKTGPIAAAGLMLIMIGALYTHNHNKDPFSASYPAIIQFFTMALMQVLYYFEQAVNPGAMDYILSGE